MFLGIASDVWISGIIAVAGLVGAAGLVLAGWLGISPGGFGRVSLFCGLAGAGVIVGLVGAMLQGDKVRIGGSGPRLLDAADPASATGGSAGFAFPLGAVGGLVLLAALLLVAGTALRQPRAIGAAAGGWLAVVGLLMFGTGNAGDVVLANDTAAQIFVYGGLVVAFGIGVLVYQWQLTDRIARAAANRPADRVH